MIKKIPRSFTKTIGMASISMAGASAVTKEDFIFILSILMMVVNAILEYLRTKKNNKKEADKD